MTRPFITPALVVTLARTVSRRAALVWLYVWSRADRDTAVAWPGVRTIAEDIGIKPGHVSEDIGSLEAGGWLSVNRSPGNKSSYVVRAPQSVYPKTGTLPPESVSQNGNGVCPKTGTQCIPKREHHPNTTKNTTKARGKAAAVVEVPKELDTEAFTAAWADWLAYRRERKLTLTPRTLTAKLAELAAWGPDVAIIAIRQSIKEGWQGIFRPNGESRNGKPKHDPVASGRCPR